MSHYAHTAQVGDVPHLKSQSSEKGNDRSQEFCTVDPYRRGYTWPP